MKLTQTVEWVPVSERLPEVYQECVIMLKNDAVMIAMAMSGHFSTLPGAYQIDLTRVSHWAAPLLHPNQLAK